VPHAGQPSRAALRYADPQAVVADVVGRRPLHHLSTVRRRALSKKGPPAFGL
jgi:hypothetical protein